jgi:hypothetical protein
MWLITQTGFISLVQDRKDPSQVWVRARIKEDIAQTFPAYADRIVTKIGADYIYRLIVPKDVAALAMWNAVQDVDYDSHAKEVMNRRSHPNPKRMSAYYKIWNALAELQPFAPYSHQPRAVQGLAPKKAQAPLAFSSKTPAWQDSDEYGSDHPLSTGTWLRGNPRSTGHYDWSKHPQSKTTGFRNGQPVDSYPAADADSVDLDNDDLTEISDAELLGMTEDDFEDYVAKTETAHTGPKGKRNPRRRGRGKAAAK